MFDWKNLIKVRYIYNQINLFKWKLYSRGFNKLVFSIVTENYKSIKTQIFYDMFVIKWTIMHL